jgi:asparagine synthase (glutamine-hydrolysing)
MCGFAGLIDFTRSTSRETLLGVVAEMATALQHRGPDSSGVWVDEEVGVALGHRRLAIIDLSAAGHQPMVSGDGDRVLIYNGLVYNFAELRSELEAVGRRFAGRSDTEVILAAIAEWGLEAAVSRFIGMFAFALWDRRHRQLHLVRDRLGIKPLYYGRLGSNSGSNLFAFGSELKAFRAHPSFDQPIDREALTLFMQRNCIPAPHSIYRGIYKLTPGHMLTLSLDDREIPSSKPYWTLRDAVENGTRDPFRGTEQEATDELEALLRDAIRRRLVADVPVGVFLSGGIDSSVVTALMQTESSQPVKSFTIGFDDGAYNEAADAARVARHLGTDHRELYVTPADALAVVPKLATIYDEPFADSSQLPTFLVSQLARSEVTVALSGDGGDEMFGGYNRYLWNQRIAKRVERWPAWLRQLSSRTLTALSPARWDSLFAHLPGAIRQRNPGDKLHKLAPILEANGAAEMYARQVTHWPNASSLVIDGGMPQTAATDRAAWAAVDDFVDQMMYLDGISYLPDDILTKVDRAAMAVALEARVPILDHRVVAFAWRLPQATKIRNGTGKLPLRRILERYVPSELIDRPKMGFATPLHDWFRGALRDWMEALIDERRLEEEGFFDPKPIRTAWADHLSGRRNCQHELWDVAMFQAWHEASGA